MLSPEEKTAATCTTGFMVYSLKLRPDINVNEDEINRSKGDIYTFAKDLNRLLCAVHITSSIQKYESKYSEHY